MAFITSLEPLWAASSLQFENAFQFIKSFTGNQTDIPKTTEKILESQIGWSNPPEPSNMPFNIDLQMVFSLFYFLVIFLIPFFLTNYLLPASSHSRRDRWLFGWHLFDALVHFGMEGLFLFHCFFSYAPISPSESRDPVFLGDKDHVYGATYSNSPTAKLWHEYALADHRWGGADPTIISIELITVIFGGITASLISYWVYQAAGRQSREKEAIKAKMWFMMIVLATAEIYGGFMTFLPEMLTGNTALATDSFLYFVLYIVIFNGLWVVVPGWILWEAWKEFTGSSTVIKRQRDNCSPRHKLGR
ncbi:EBP domain protein [Aspergillus piperis CBS 112811]|uniref:EBP domain protein n=1 Tax=Aspergillus piperis CBS 112811 TaxID=1448313 RepID=A0A8G1VNN3_9EURO|nr:EBP domain protein [Aspergillus piperis CBS 112811]RAH59961.1 EBP domain protein [Aspergillus piperis CBS 112811]